MMLSTLAAIRIDGRKRRQRTSALRVAQIRSQAAAAGALGGFRTYLQFIEDGLTIVSREVNDAIQFAYIPREDGSVSSDWGATQFLYGCDSPLREEKKVLRGVKYAQTQEFC